MSGIYDITPFSLLDFPDIPAAILWFSGCNLRCRYCYNPDIVLGEGRISEASVLSILSKRVGLLEGVVLSGGEATLYPNIVGLSQEIKSLGYKIKLDTNAMRPDIVERMLGYDLLDYVAMDYKSPESKMKAICGSGEEKRFWKTFDLMKGSGVAYEVRTTFHPDLLSDDDLIEMSKALVKAGYNRPFFVQNYRSGSVTLGEIADPLRVMNRKRLEEFVTFRT